MKETIESYPALQMEDDGFLWSVKDSISMGTESLFSVQRNETARQIINRLVNDNGDVTDRGSQLPLYVPLYSDENELVGRKVVSVWSGAHVDAVLYPGYGNDAVESYIYGNPRTYGRFGAGFMACDPAFKLALFTHYIVQNVILDPLCAEYFILGRYYELARDDVHYAETGIPSTELYEVSPISGLRLKRCLMPTGDLCISHGSAKYEGWNIRVRGPKPKESTIRECWQESRTHANNSGKVRFVINDVEYKTLECGVDGRVRERSGNSDVDYMIKWVDMVEQRQGLPRRGSRIDWVALHRMFEDENMKYINRWSKDTMRKTYLRRKSAGK